MLNRRSSKRRKQQQTQSRSSSVNRCEYSQLETRNLLATMILGSPAHDVVDVSFVDANTVNITQNGNTRSNVDISDGLTINLLDGNDSVTIDHQIVADVTLAEIEKITITGDQHNEWQIGAFENSTQLLAPIVAGKLNSNVRFAGVAEIVGGGGTDVFTINAMLDYDLNIFGGAGNDLFRFTGDGGFFAPMIGGDVITQRPRVVGYGEAGNDRFNYYGLSDDLGIGGEGFDILDYSQADQGVHTVVNQLNVFGFQNNRIIGAEGASNSVDVTLYNAPELHWYLGGDWAVVTDLSSGQTIELMNFDTYMTSLPSYNKVWVLETTKNIQVFDADWIQIGSKENAEMASLDTVAHSVGILCSPINYAPSMLLLSPPVDQIPKSPTVVIANQGGSSGTLMLHEDGSIRSRSSRFYFSKDSNYLPIIEIHGSSEADYFLVETTWTSVSIFGHDGDDTFLIGGLNSEGDLTRIATEITVIGGDGTDRLYLNDQKNVSGQTNYRLENGSISDATEKPSRFAKITFNESLELARVNGSITEQNRFTAAPSGSTTFIVDGIPQNIFDDVLTIEGLRDVRTISNDNGTGSWSFDGQRQPVYFYGIENPEETSDPVGASFVRVADIPLQSNAYNYIGHQVITSADEMAQLVDTLESYPYHFSIVADAFRELDIDFDEENFVMYQHTENSGGIKLDVGEPFLKDGELVIRVDREGLPPGSGATMAMDYRGYGYVIDKAFSEIVFEVDNQRIELS